MSVEITEAPKKQSKYLILAKRLLPWIKFAIVAAVLVWVLRELYLRWDNLSAYPWKFHAGWLILAGISYLVAYFPAAVFWKHVLHLMGQRPDSFAATRAYYISQLGKYTPGKAMVIIMRADIIHGPNVRASCAAAGVFFETFAMMSIGAFLAAIITGFWFQGHQWYWTFLGLNILMLVLSMIPTIPVLFRVVAKKLRVGQGDPDMDSNMKKLRFRTVLYGWGLMGIGWIFFGLSLWCTVKGLGLEPEPIVALPKYIAISAMSVVLGFVLMLPGGFGAREWVLIQFLAPMFAASLAASGGDPTLAEGFAIAAAGAQRIVSILAELAISAALIGIKRR